MQSLPNANKSFPAYMGAVLVIVAAGLWLIIRFAESQAQQEMATRQERITLIADSRAEAASAWLNRHLNTVEELAGDASIQLYAGQVATEGNSEAVEGQRGYIFSLLSAESERSGFHEQRAIDSVAANVKRPRRAGLAVIKTDGTALVMTTGMPFLRPQELHFGAKPSFIKVGPALDDKTPLVLFGAQIQASMGIDADSTAWVIGARPLDGDFLKALEQPGDQDQTAETYIVSPGDGAIVTALTPLAEGGRVGIARQDNAASFAVEQPGGFGIYTNYAGTDVLVTGKELTAPVPWILVRTVSAVEATAAISARRNNLIITLSLAALFVFAALILAWRHGVSKRLESSYKEQEALSHQNKRLSQFLQSVSDGQPSAVAALDADMTVRFTNNKMAEVTGITVAELTNRRIDTAFTGTIAEDIRAAAAYAAKGKASNLKISHGKDGMERLYKTDMLPLKAGGENSASVLMVMLDISDLIAAQGRSEILYKQLIGTLTEIIDARDPWSKHHSGRVADVAVTIAEEMNWDEEERESIGIAGQLVNIGKIFVPTSVLTKQTPLTEDELTLVRDSMHKGAALINGVEFKGPVARILGQMHEHWDGSGEPVGLSGEDIEAGARILAVANAFVGIVSARAHREGLGFDKAADILHTDAGSKYERRVVAALQNILENKKGRARWQHYMDKPTEG